MQNLRRRSGRTRVLASRFSRQTLSTIALKWAVIGVIVFFLMGLGVFAYFSRGLPEPGKIQRNSGFSTVFYDRDGKVLFEMFEDKNRIPVEIKDVPPYLKQATVAIEDKSFYQHKTLYLSGLHESANTLRTTSYTTQKVRF